MSRKITGLMVAVASLLLCSCSASFEIGSMRDIGGSSSEAGDTTTSGEVEEPVEEPVDAGKEEDNGGESSEAEVGSTTIGGVELSEAGKIAMNAYEQFELYDFVLTATSTRSGTQFDKEFNPLPTWDITTTSIHEKDGTLHHAKNDIVFVKADEYMELFPDALRVETIDYEVYLDTADGMAFEKEDGVWSSSEVTHDASTMYFPMIFRNPAVWQDAIITELSDGGYSVVCTIPGYIISDTDVGMTLNLESYFDLADFSDLDNVHTTTAIVDFDSEGRFTMLRVPDIIVDVYGADISMTYDAELKMTVEYKDVSLQIPAEAMSR